MSKQCFKCNQWSEEVATGESCPFCSPEPAALPTAAELSTHDEQRAEIESLRRKVEDIELREKAVVESWRKRCEKADQEIADFKANNRYQRGYGDGEKSAKQEAESLRKRVADLERDYVERGKWFSSETVRRKEVEQERDEWKAKAEKLEASANHHRGLGITLLDAKYLDPNCWKGCKSLVHQHRIERLTAALVEIQRLVMFHSSDYALEVSGVALAALAEPKPADQGAT